MRGKPCGFVGDCEVSDEREEKGMKYKIEIWQYHSIVETFETDSYDELLEWYKTNWSWTYENGGCAKYVYEDGETIRDDRKYDFM